MDMETKELLGQLIQEIHAQNRLLARMIGFREGDTCKVSGNRTLYEDNTAATLEWCYSGRQGDFLNVEGTVIHKETPESDCDPA